MPIRVPYWNIELQRSRGSDVLQPRFRNGKKALVLLHGYYGSFLNSSINGIEKRVFIDPKELLLGRYSLSLFSETLASPKAPLLKNGGMMGSVRVGPLESPVYNPLWNALDTLEYTMVPFAYDWRQDLLESMQELESLLKKLSDNFSEVFLVAHSMGGLISAYYLRYGCQNPITATETWEGLAYVKKAAFLGVPFRGTMALLKNFSRGVTFYSNTSFLSKESVASFPSSYFLLPQTQEIQNAGFWEEFQIGLMAKKPTATAIQWQNRKKFTQEQLRKSAAFQEKILAPSSKTIPLPVLNVIGKGRLTHAYYEKQLQYLAFFPKEAPQARGITGDGDESILQSSAVLPVAFESAAKAIYTTYPHSALFNDPKVQEELRQFLGDANV